MKPWPFFALLLLFQQSASHAQSRDPLISKGEEALADGLWEVAEMHYRESMGSAGLPPAEKASLGMRLAESMVRGGKPAEALELLGQSFLAKHPERLFWKAQALAGQHHFAEASGIFGTLLDDSTSPFRVESGFTRASIQLALGQTEEALQTLSLLMPGSDPDTLVKIQLQRVEILLDLGRTEEARLGMPPEETVPAALRSLVLFLRGQVMLREEDYTAAESVFRELVTLPKGQSLENHHAAFVGLADAIHAQGNSESATRVLLSFIQDHPESPALDAMFGRILEWLPERPSPADSVLSRISGDWINSQSMPAIWPVVTQFTDAVGAWPVYQEPSLLTDRLAYSLYTLAVGQHRIATPESRAEAERLFIRLRTENPTHILATRSLYQQARWALDEGLTGTALSLLDTMIDTSANVALKGQAALLEARVSLVNDDPENAIRFFDLAARSLEGRQARSAKLQAAITRMRHGDPAGVTLIQQDAKSPPDPEFDADLELERALAATPADAAKTALAAFLTRHPDHPRAAEARLAAAEAALSGPAPDPGFAAAQLGALAADPENADDVPPQRVALAGLRAMDLSGDSAGTIAAAQAIIDTYPADPVAADASLTLGRALFQSGSYNPARLILEKLAATDTDPARAQTAWLLAARAAALGATPQSREQARTLFDNAIGTKGPVTSLAILEKARLLIDMYLLPEAVDFLRKWIKTLPESDPLQLPAGLLLGEALYAKGSGSTDSLLEALAIYDRLLSHAEEHPALLNRLQYLRGTTLEQLPDEKDPTRKRESQAFQAYHSVLETTTPPAEWDYFELCGLRALALLEKAKRWEAAITVAKKIAAFKGPQAEAAANRAKELQLEHMIWTD